MRVAAVKRRFQTINHPTQSGTHGPLQDPFFHNVIDASQTLEDKLHREQGQQILSVVGILIQTMCCYKSRFCIWAFASECSFLIAVKKNKSKKNEHKYQRGGKAART